MVVPVATWHVGMIRTNTHGLQIRSVFLDAEVTEHTCHPDPTHMCTRTRARTHTRQGNRPMIILSSRSSRQALRTHLTSTCVFITPLKTLILHTSRCLVPHFGSISKSSQVHFLSPLGSPALSSSVISTLVQTAALSLLEGFPHLPLTPRPPFSALHQNDPL